MNIKEKVFIEYLTEVPNIPESILENVDKKIKKRKTFINTLRVTSLLIILSIGLIFFNNKPLAVATEYDAEVINELQVAMDFFDSNKLDDELNMYTIIEPDIF